MTEQINDNITGLLGSALALFFFINIFMFSSLIDRYRDWGDIITIIVIDLFFILLVSIGIWAIANL